MWRPGLAASAFRVNVTRIPRSCAPHVQRHEGCHRQRRLRQSQTRRSAHECEGRDLRLAGDAQVEVEHTVERSAYCMSHQECRQRQQQCASSSSADGSPLPPPGACERETAWRGPHAQDEWVTLDSDDVGFVVGVPAADSAGVSLISANALEWAIAPSCDCVSESQSSLLYCISYRESRRQRGSRQGWPHSSGHSGHSGHSGGSSPHAR